MIVHLGFPGDDLCGSLVVVIHSLVFCRKFLSLWFVPFISIRIATVDDIFFLPCNGQYQALFAAAFYTLRLFNWYNFPSNLEHNIRSMSNNDEACACPNTSPEYMGALCTVCVL